MSRLKSFGSSAQKSAGVLSRRASSLRSVILPARVAATSETYLILGTNAPVPGNFVAGNLATRPMSPHFATLSSCTARSKRS